MGGFILFSKGPEHETEENLRHGWLGRLPQKLKRRDEGRGKRKKKKKSFSALLRGIKKLKKTPDLTGGGNSNDIAHRSII